MIRVGWGAATRSRTLTCHVELLRNFRTAQLDVRDAMHVEAHHINYVLVRKSLLACSRNRTPPCLALDWTTAALPPTAQRETRLASGLAGTFRCPC